MTLYEGPHDIRLLGLDEEADFQFDPLTESMADVVDRIAAEWRPDLVICWFPEKCPPPRGMEECPVPTVVAAGDWDVHYPDLAVNLGRYDVVLADKAGVEVFESEWVHPHHLFPLYSQLSSVHRRWDEEKDIDVVFAGSLNHARHYERGRLLQRLAALSDRHRIVLAEGAHGEAYGRLLSRARIVFNYAIRGELNLRVFETFACGSLLFLEETNREARDWLREDVDVVFYNEDNVEEKIAYYLERPGEAQAIAARGHARAPEFAGENRFTRLIDWAAAQPGSGRPFRELSPLEKDFQTALMYRFMGAPEYQVLEAALVDELVRRAPADPRMWTCVGNHFMNPHHAEGDEAHRGALYEKAFLQAHQLDPDSAPYALNAALACLMRRNEPGEESSLRAAIAGESLAGEGLLIERHFHPFWPRWQRALAERRQALGMVQAEAHNQLAAILAQRPGCIGEAEEHLFAAQALDADSVSALSLLGEVLWVTGRRDEAVAMLQDRLEDLPLDITARRRLHEMLVAMGRQAEADAVAAELARFERARCTPADLERGGG
ncbi:MAG: glycosyltransferase [Candidatus Hydrogenedentes bacterium]|nr:glycosyltransferase [Candidatus Hydrogenedentota bacterium]